MFYKLGMKNLSSAFGQYFNEESLVLRKLETAEPEIPLTSQSIEPDLFEITAEDGEITDEEIDALADSAESVVFEIVGDCPREVARILMMGHEGMGGEKLEKDIAPISFQPTQTLENPTPYKLLFLDNADPMAIQAAVLKTLGTIPRDVPNNTPNILIASPSFSPEEGTSAARYALHAHLNGLPKGKRQIIFAPSDANPEAWALAIQEQVSKILEPEAPVEQTLAVGEPAPAKRTIAQRIKGIFFHAPTGRKAPRTLKILGDV